MKIMISNDKLFNLHKTRFFQIFLPRNYLQIVLFVILAISVLSFGCAGGAVSAKAVKRSNAHYMLGTTYINQNRLQDAFLAFQKSLAEDPKNKDSLNMLGYVYFLLGEYDQALEIYQKAILIDPNFSEAYNNMALTYNAMKKWDESIASCIKALENPLYITPEFALNNMGQAYMMKGDYSAAIKTLKRALMRRPIPQASYNLALTYIRLGNDSRAIRELEMLVEHAPKYVDAHFELAMLYQKRGETDKARKHFTEAISAGPGSELSIRAKEELKKMEIK